MAYETRDNSGSLFKNNYKEKETQPDRTGKAKIGGVEYKISGWVKKTQSGDQYLSLSFQLPKEQQQQTSAPANPSNELNDEILW